MSHWALLIATLLFQTMATFDSSFASSFADSGASNVTIEMRNLEQWMTDHLSKSLYGLSQDEIKQRQDEFLDALARYESLKAELATKAALPKTYSNSRVEVYGQKINLKPLIDITDLSLYQTRDMNFNLNFISFQLQGRAAEHINSILKTIIAAVHDPTVMAAFQKTMYQIETRPKQFVGGGGSALDDIFRTVNAQLNELATGLSATDASVVALIGLKAQAEWLKILGTLKPFNNSNESNLYLFAIREKAMQRLENRISSLSVLEPEFTTKAITSFHSRPAKFSRNGMIDQAQAILSTTNLVLHHLEQIQSNTIRNCKSVFLRNMVNKSRSKEKLIEN